MKDVKTKIRSYCDQHGLFQPGEKVIVAVSGGPDSMALLHYLIHEKDLQLKIEAAHVDHLLRGAESADDLAFVEKYCHEHQLRCHTASLNVQEKMKDSGIGLQEAAREVRYDFLRNVMKEADATALVLGHHADDQIETVLFRLVRGSTMKGRAGIQAKRIFGNGFLVRPFLAITKEEIEQYCEHHNIPVRVDPSNEKDDYTRNRFRHHIIPLLKQENPALHEQVIRFTEEVAEDESYLEEAAQKRLKELVIEKNDHFYKIDQEKWCAEAPPLQRRLIHLILNYLYAKVPTSLSSAHTIAIKKLFEQKHPSGELHLPQGLIVTRSYSTVIFHFASLSIQQDSYYFRLNSGQTLNLPHGAKISAVDGIVEDGDTSIDICRFDSRNVQWPLTVRSRQDGDRIELEGLSGSKKIKKVFIDEKIPFDQRSRWPIVADASGRVLWIPGLRTAKGVEKPQDGNHACTLIHYKDLLGGHSSC